MKRNYQALAIWAFSLLWMGCVFGELGGSQSSCSADCVGTAPDPDLARRLAASSKDLETRKTASANSYAYSVNLHSWTGDRSWTKVTVKGGIVAKREYAGSSPDDSGKVVPDPPYTEIDNVGEHWEGFRPLTLDSLYAKCRGYIAGSPSRGRAILEFDRDNILRACGFVVNGCQDDCGAAIMLDTLVWDP